MNILILGSKSFVGNEIYKSLKVKKRLNIFTVKKYFDENDINNLTNLDFYKKYFINYKKFDFIINLIHIHKKNLKDEVNINVQLIKKIIYFQKLKKSKIIYLSSVNCSNLRNNKYSFSKCLIEKQIIKTKNYKIIRPSTVVFEKNNQYIGGTNGTSLKAINFFIKYFLFFPVVNKGNFLHTICFLDDLVKFIYILIIRDLFRNQTINFFTGEYLNYKKFILFLAKRQNRKVNFINIPIIFIIFFIKILAFINIFKIDNQMLKNLMSQRIEFDRTLKISKYLNLKKVV